MPWHLEFLLPSIPDTLRSGHVVKPVSVPIPARTPCPAPLTGAYCSINGLVLPVTSTFRARARATQQVHLMSPLETVPLVLVSGSLLGQLVPQFLQTLHRSVCRAVKAWPGGLPGGPGAQALVWSSQRMDPWWVFSSPALSSVRDGGVMSSKRRLRGCTMCLPCPHQTGTDVLRADLGPV